jgi:hypothetical protein
MFSHLFLLSNNKYFVVNNNNKHYKLSDAINEYSKHNWIINNDTTFITHIETKSFNNNDLNKYYKYLYGHNNIHIINNDKWSYYGINHIERFKNLNSYKSKILTSQ